jgi:hypothetical protein
VCAVDYEVGTQANLCHGVDEGRASRNSGFQLARSGNERNSRVPKGSQVLDGLPNAVLIIDANICNTRCVRTHIDKYERNLAETEVFEQVLFHTKRQDRDPVHAAFDHAADGHLHAFRVVDGRGQQDFVIVFDSQIFEGLHDSGKNGFVISDTTRPKIRLLPDTRARARVLGKYPSSSTTFQTRLESSGSTLGTRLIARETVAVETFARRAISRMSIGFKEN